MLIEKANRLSPATRRIIQRLVPFPAVGRLSEDPVCRSGLCSSHSILVVAYVISCYTHSCLFCTTWFLTHWQSFNIYFFLVFAPFCSWILKGFLFMRCLHVLPSLHAAPVDIKDESCLSVSPQLLRTSVTWAWWDTLSSLKVSMCWTATEMWWDRPKSLHDMWVADHTEYFYTLPVLLCFL